MQSLPMHQILEKQLIGHAVAYVEEMMLIGIVQTNLLIPLLLILLNVGRTISRIDLELIWGRYTDSGHAKIGHPNWRNVEKEKRIFWIKIKKLLSETLFRKLNIELEHTDAVNRTKNYYSNLLIFLSRHRWESTNKLLIAVNKAVRSARILPLGTNHCSISLLMPNLEL